MYKKRNARGNKTRIIPVTKSSLRAGDIVYVPRKTLHWHGARIGSNFAHLAFNLFTGKGREAKTIWYDSDFKSFATRIS